MCDHNINTTGMQVDQERSAEKFEDEKKEMGEQMEKLRQGMTHVAHLVNGRVGNEITVTKCLFH